MFCMPSHFSSLLQKYLQNLFGWHLGLLPDHWDMVALGDRLVLWPGCYTWSSSKAPAPLFSSLLKSYQMVTRQAGFV